MHAAEWEQQWVDGPGYGAAQSVNESRHCTALLGLQKFGLVTSEASQLKWAARLPCYAALAGAGAAAGRSSGTALRMPLMVARSEAAAQQAGQGCGTTRQGHQANHTDVTACM